MILLKTNWFTRRLVNTKIINTCGPRVDKNPTGNSVILVAVSGPNRHKILQCFMLVIPNVLLPNGYFLTLKIRNFLKINLDQTAGIDRIIWTVKVKHSVTKYS